MYKKPTNFNDSREDWNPFYMYNAETDTLKRKENTAKAMAFAPHASRMPRTLTREQSIISLILPCE